MYNFISTLWAWKGTRQRRSKEAQEGITKPAIRRRGGVKHISGLIYKETRGVLKIFFGEWSSVMLLLILNYDVIYETLSHDRDFLRNSGSGASFLLLKKDDLLWARASLERDSILERKSREEK
ncbi:hypothetical protein IFM89_031605 [Coptis chinensis]|uniref:Uncharacterized protein n=1 Tax=Coptis chinensis TaxID=261450 RepID=A0A835LJ89_9MAGN|nr:hypothetical protein IFM89_031605 [Coptis chinensis]